MNVGSLQNLLADQAPDEAAVEVGAGATIVSWTDRQACTVIEVSPSGHRVTAQYDTATRTDSNGMSDAQSYEFERNEQGATRVFSRRKNGDYRLVGGTARLLVGVRSHYHDYSF